MEVCVIMVGEREEIAPEEEDDCLTGSLDSESVHCRATRDCRRWLWPAQPELRNRLLWREEKEMGNAAKLKFIVFGPRPRHSRDPPSPDLLLCGRERA